MITEIKIPELGENIESGTVVKIAAAAGDVIKKDQTLLEIEVSKAVVEIPSPVNGTIKEILVEEQAEVKPGDTFMTCETAAAQAEPAREKETKPDSGSRLLSAGKDLQTSAERTENAAGEVHASPVIRMLARESGVDVTKVKGTGPDGRITENDVRIYAAAAGGKKLKPLPDFSKWGEIERSRLSEVRLNTARHIFLAWSGIPHVTLHDKADVTELEQLIKKHSSEQRKLTLTPFLVKIAAAGLKRFPQFNASVDLAAREIIRKKYCHISVAVDTEQGLLAPVIRDADKKNIFAIAAELKEKVTAARNRTLKNEAMQGGCFTVTNLGSIGGTGFSPIINWPEGAILGAARSRREPVYVEDRLVPRQMLPLSLAIDHRLLDGADGARFLRWFVEALEQPLLLELEG